MPGVRNVKRTATGRLSSWRQKTAFSTNATNIRLGKDNLQTDQNVKRTATRRLSSDSDRKKTAFSMKDIEAGNDLLDMLKFQREIAKNSPEDIRHLIHLSNAGNREASYHLGKILQHDSTSYAMFYLGKARKQGHKKASNEYLRVALMYGSPSMLTDEQKRTCIDIMRNIKELSLRDIPDGYIDFFEKYLPESPVCELKIRRHAERIMKSLPQSLTLLDITNNGIGAKGIKMIPKSTLANITALYITGNHVGKEGVDFLIKYCSNLSILALDRDDTAGNDLGRKEFPKLMILDVYGN